MIEPNPIIDWKAATPTPADWRDAGEIEHGFTHFTLTLRILRAEVQAAEAIWSARRDLDGLPSVFLKAARAGLSRLI